MLAAYAARLSPDAPLTAVEVGERPEPEQRPGWTTVEVRAAALNHHDLWALRGVGLTADRLPMVLGTDAAGVTADGREVVVHAVIGGPAAPTGQTVAPDEPRSLLSERYPGTLAERVSVPATNLLDKPPSVSFVEAACLPTSWLTAYRMLFVAGRVTPGQRVLVQGAGGGVSTAALVLGVTAGVEVWVTSRDEERGRRAVTLGAAGALPPGGRPAGPVDVVLETVGAATWAHSVRTVRPGGIIVVAGATTGDPAAAGLRRVFFQEITVVGVTMGSRDDLAHLLAMLDRTGARPLVDSTYPLSRAHDALARLESGAQFGKIVLAAGT